MQSLDNTDCKDGWTKQRFCVKVYCYKRLDVGNNFQDFERTVENDYCHSYEPESHLASIHCIKEHYFAQNFSAKTLLGLHIPFKFHNDPFDVKNFKWTDGTDVDFVGWNRFSLPEFDGQYAPLFPKKQW
uniref:C-type lectin domain-containing protein n=1 Tax=Panagrellus redivivus TaxID=6233 RepID=A0A7E4V3N1_PANRE